jgi:hypothetical protein
MKLIDVFLGDALQSYELTESSLSARLFERFLEVDFFAFRHQIRLPTSGANASTPEPISPRTS